MRSLLANLLPDEETVLVLSDGDDDLLALERPAWHFPHGNNGKHVPLEGGSGDHAARQLQTLAGGGVRYLVVPAPLLWSLARRPALADYLGRCRRLALRPRVCAVYELAAAPARSTYDALRPKEAAWK
jgi:hypothetical protein